MEAHLRLKLERKLRGWSQAKVANEIGTTPNSVSMWERGIALPTPHFRERLTVLFGKNALELGFYEAEEDTSEHENASNASVFEHVLPSSPSHCYDPMLPLPPSTELVGRITELSLLKRHLTNGERQLALCGLPGVGKTTLAVTLAHDPVVRTLFPDGVLWAGMGPHGNTIQHLTRWGNILGMSASEISSLQSCDEWTLALHRHIGTRSLLVVIDDVWNVEEVLPYLVGSSSCAHLITTRFPQIALHIADGHLLRVSELGEEDGYTLLARLAPEVVSYDSVAAHQLVEAVGRLPLALVLMGKYLRLQGYSQQPRRVHRAIQYVQRTEERLRLSDSQAVLTRHSSLPLETPLSLQSVIATSDCHLHAQARQCLYALSIFPAKPNSFSEEAALFVSQSSEEVLDQLSDAGLLETSSPGRYMLHQTIADYARTRLTETTSYERLVTYALHFAETHATQCEQLEQESSLILAALDMAYDKGMASEFIRGVITFGPFLAKRGMYTVAEQYLLQASQKALEKKDVNSSIFLLLWLGEVRECLGHYAEAERSLQEGLRLAYQEENHPQRGKLSAKLGSVAEKQGNYAQAERYYQEGLAFARQGQYLDVVCFLLVNLGSLVRKKGDYSQAENYYREGLALARQIEQPNLIITLLTNFGVLVEKLGQYMQAERYYHEGLQLARQSKHTDNLCLLLINFGVLKGRQGDYRQAEQYWLEGLQLARQAGEPDRISLLLANLGFLMKSRGDFSQAGSYYQEGLALARKINHPDRISLLLMYLGELAEIQTDDEQAEAYYQKGLSLARRIGMQERVSGLLTHLGRLLAKRGCDGSAEDFLQEGLQLARRIGNTWFESSNLNAWGELYVRQQKLEHAEEAFQKCIVLNETKGGNREDLADAYYGLGHIALQQGNVLEAQQRGQVSLAIFQALDHYKSGKVQCWLQHPCLQT